jgi:D-tyrosyl-tRNA(Tyr) deacylase
LRIVIQRVTRASVEVNGEIVGQINKGILVLFGACKSDTVEKALYLADRCAGLRIFEDTEGRMNLALKDISGEVLAVSQFTLCADVYKGRRPSFDNAMEPVEAKILFDQFCRAFSAQGFKVQTGRFGEKMAVELVNDGPVTIVMEH